jgi:hypothetical protein
LKDRGRPLQLAFLAEKMDQVEKRRVHCALRSAEEGLSARTLRGALLERWLAQCGVLDPLYAVLSAAAGRIVLHAALHQVGVDSQGNIYTGEVVSRARGSAARVRRGMTDGKQRS